MGAPKNVIAAVARLVKTTDGAALQVYLEAELQAFKNLLVDLPTDKAVLYQGKAQFARELTQLFREAPELADKQR